MLGWRQPLGAGAITLATIAALVAFPTPAGAVACTTRQVTAFESDGAFAPTISDDGSTIAFQSDSDDIGVNPEENDEVYLYDVATDVFDQVTQTGNSVDNTFPALNADGTRVAFVSTGDLDPGTTPPETNSDGNREIFLHQTGDGSFQQITAAPAGQVSEDPGIDDDGTHIAFESTWEFGGTNTDHNREVWLYDVDLGAAPLAVTNTNNPMFASGGTAIDADGSRVAYVSNKDGGNNEV